MTLKPELWIYDPIRCKKVISTPEERVRQALLSQMLDSLLFPKGLISVEKKISSGLRRIDIMVYQKVGTEEGLSPLLLIECKATQADEEAAFRQAVGYINTVKAPYWCIAHTRGLRTFWHDGNAFQSVPFLPSYPQLLSAIA